MIDPAEALLACTGLARVLAGKPPTARQLARAEALDVELEKVCAGYLRGRRSEPRPVAELPELPPSLPEGGHDAVAGLDPTVATMYGLASARALGYLNQLCPRRALAGLVARVANRTAAELATLRRCTQAVEDPLGLLGDIDGLAEDQVETLRAVYPSMFSELGMACATAMSAADRELSGREERALGRLLGASAPDVASIQALHRHEEAKQKGAGQGQPGPGLATPMQELAGK